jgi:hypothetical protein
MRSLLPVAVALGLALAVDVPGRAQAPPKVIIDPEGVRVGFATGGGGGAGSKTGYWTPVYVALTAGLDRVGPADGDVVVKTTDSDDMENVYRVPLPPLEPKEQRSVIAYARPGATGSEINVTIESKDRRLIAQQRTGRTGYAAAPPGSFLYVTAGGNAAASHVSLYRALRPEKGGGAAEANGNDLGNLLAEDPNSLIQVAHIGQARDLPTRWFGYNAVDVLILGTSSPTFVRELLEDKANRKEALAEWVRRGGRLVIAVGREHQLVKALLEQLDVIPCTLNGTVQRKSLLEVSRWAGHGVSAFVAPPPRNKPGAEQPPIDLVKIEVKPGRGVQTLVPDREPDRPPVIVQGSAGLGRVILVGFDLDMAPFLDWPGKAAFWKKLDTELRPNQQAANNPPNFNAARFGGGAIPGWDDTHTDVGTLMQDRLEAFNEVPVISFGWVALFILVYIIVVGPLDYFFLKKVVKRLELTWITFPAVVLIVSALAYVSAYYLKGNDLRINKVDLVDIVAETPEEDAAAPHVARGARAYGTTWFTVFSPRIQNYTVGVEPSAPTWVPEVDKKAAPNPHSAVVSWMGRPENAYGGTGRGSGSQSLFRRAYEYAPDASGLLGVPIQVWSTKTFTGSWQAALAEDRPLVRAELKHTKGPQGEVLTGSITSELPAELTNVYLFYQGKFYELPNLAPRAARKLEPPLNVHGGKQLEEWFQNVQIPAQNFNNPWQQQRNRGQTMQSAQGIIKDLMFGDKDTTAGHPRNTTLRFLDETWQLNRPGEAIVVGWLPRLEKAAESVSTDPASPSRIWLGQLPEPGKPRPSLAGKMTQEAYVRIFIPVVTSEK